VDASLSSVVEEEGDGSNREHGGGDRILFTEKETTSNHNMDTIMDDDNGKSVPHSTIPTDITTISGNTPPSLKCLAHPPPGGQLQLSPPRYIQRVQNANHVQGYVRIRNAVCATNSTTAMSEQVLFVALQRAQLYGILSGNTRNPIGFSDSFHRCKMVQTANSLSLLPIDYVVLVVVGVTGHTVVVACAAEAQRYCAPPISIVPKDSSRRVCEEEEEAVPHAVLDAESGRIWLYEPLQWCPMYILSDVL
jgi:hypothetical protein